MIKISIHYVVEKSNINYCLKLRNVGFQIVEMPLAKLPRLYRYVKFFDMVMGPNHISNIFEGFQLSST